MRFACTVLNGLTMYNIEKDVLDEIDPILFLKICIKKCPGFIPGTKAFLFEVILTDTFFSFLYYRYVLYELNICFKLTFITRNIYFNLYIKN